MPLLIGMKEDELVLWFCGGGGGVLEQRKLHEMLRAHTHARQMRFGASDRQPTSQRATGSASLATYLRVSATGAALATHAATNGS